MEDAEGKDSNQMGQIRVLFFYSEPFGLHLQRLGVLFTLTVTREESSEGGCSSGGTLL